MMDLQPPHEPSSPAEWLDRRISTSSVPASDVDKPFSGYLHGNPTQTGQSQDKPTQATDTPSSSEIQPETDATNPQEVDHDLDPDAVAGELQNDPANESTTDHSLPDLPSDDSLTPSAADDPVTELADDEHESLVTNPSPDTREVVPDRSTEIEVDPDLPGARVAEDVEPQTEESEPDSIDKRLVTNLADTTSATTFDRSDELTADASTASDTSDPDTTVADTTVADKQAAADGQQTSAASKAEPSIVDMPSQATAGVEKRVDSAIPDQKTHLRNHQAQPTTDDADSTSQPARTVAGDDVPRDARMTAVSASETEVEPPAVPADSNVSQAAQNEASEADGDSSPLPHATHSHTGKPTSSVAGNSTADGLPPGNHTSYYTSQASLPATDQPAATAAVLTEFNPPVEPTADTQTTPGDQATSRVSESATSANERLAQQLFPRPTASDGTMELSPGDQARFIKRVAQALQAAPQQRGGTLRLRLHPPELGSMSLEVETRSGMLTAKIETETQAARSLLFDHLPELRERLEQQGVRVERFDVDVAKQDSQNDSRQSFDRQRRSTATGDHRSLPNADAAETSATDLPTLPLQIDATRQNINVVI